MGFQESLPKSNMPCPQERACIASQNAVSTEQSIPTFLKFPMEKLQTVLQFEQERGKKAIKKPLQWYLLSLLLIVVIVLT